MVFLFKVHWIYRLIWDKFPSLWLFFPSTNHGIMIMLHLSNHFFLLMKFYHFLYKGLNNLFISFFHVYSFVFHYKWYISFIVHFLRETVYQVINSTNLDFETKMLEFKSCLCLLESGKSLTHFVPLGDNSFIYKTKDSKNSCVK